MKSNEFSGKCQIKATWQNTKEQNLLTVCQSILHNFLIKYNCLHIINKDWNILKTVKNKSKSRRAKIINNKQPSNKNEQVSLKQNVQKLHLFCWNKNLDTVQIREVTYESYHSFMYIWNIHIQWTHTGWNMLALNTQVLTRL